MFKPFDEFPVARADRAAGFASLVGEVRVVEVERVSVEGGVGIGEERRDVDAVDGAVGWQGLRVESGECCERREEIVGDDGCVRDGVGLSDAGQTDDAGST